jgi:hypothetical protein
MIWDGAWGAAVALVAPTPPASAATKLDTPIRRGIPCRMLLIMVDSLRVKAGFALACTSHRRGQGVTGA